MRPAELYFTGKTGVPLITGSLVGIECKHYAMYPGGDHEILIGEVEAVEFGPAQEGKGLFSIPEENMQSWDSPISPW